jgi:hypothetical protein
MEAARNYQRLALDCLNLAEAAQEGPGRESMIRMAEYWVRQADLAELQFGRSEPGRRDRSLRAA